MSGGGGSESGGSGAAFSSPLRDLERVDALLSERALADISVGAARKVAQAMAVEAVQAEIRQDEERKKLRALGVGAARKDATMQAVEQVAAAKARDSQQAKLKSLIEEKRRNEAKARAMDVLFGGGSKKQGGLKASRDGGDGLVQLREAWLQQQAEASGIE